MESINRNTVLNSISRLLNPLVSFTGTETFLSLFLSGFTKAILGLIFGSLYYGTFIDYQVISAVVIAPLYEEINRFNILGYTLLGLEILTKFMFFIAFSAVGDYKMVFKILPSVVMHIVFFVIPIPLKYRYLYHLMWNFYIFDVNTGGYIYPIQQANVVACLVWVWRYFFPLRPPTPPPPVPRTQFIPHTEHIGKPFTPNMDYYQKIMFETQSYLRAATSVPASKCKLIPLKLHEDMMFKTRTEMRVEKRDKKKQERCIRKKMTADARFAATKQRLLAKFESDHKAKEPTSPAYEMACHMLTYRSVLDELRRKVSPAPALTDEQRKLVSELLDCILAGKKTKKISKIARKLAFSVEPKDEDLRDSFLSLSTLRFTPQMFGAIRNMLPSSVPLTHSMSPTDRTVVTDMMTKITDLSDKVLNSPIIATGKVDIGFDYKSMAISVGLLLAAVLVAYLCYKYPAQAAMFGLLAGLTAIATFVFPDGVLANCIKKLSTAFQTCMLPTEPTTVAPDTPLTDIPLATHALGTTLYAIAGPIITWFHFISTGTEPKGSVVEKFMSVSTMAEKLQKNVVFCSSTLSTFLSELFSWLGDALGLGNLKNVFDLHPELSELEEKVRSMEEKLRAGTIFPDRHMGMEVAAYRTRIVKIVEKLKTGSAAAIRAGFLVKAIDVLYKVTSIGFAQNTVRAEPVCINLYSTPGKGKSTLTQSLAHEILASPGILTKEQRELYARQRENYIYCIDATQNYPDGYYSQFVTILDDWAIRKDSLNADMESGLVALIRWVNGMPYNVESAHLELKGKIFANNILMIATTNNRRIDPESFPGFTDVNALIRRLHMSYCLTYKEEYCKNPKAKYADRVLRDDLADQFVINEDGERVPSISYDVWEFVPWNMARGDVQYLPNGDKAPNLTYDQVIEEAVARVKASRDFNAKHKATIESRVAEKLRLAALADALEPQSGKPPKTDYVMTSAFWEKNHKVKAYVVKHPWVRDAFIQHVQKKFPEEVKEHLENEPLFAEYVVKLSSAYAPKNTEAAKLLGGTFIDWFKYDLARTKNPALSIVDCIEKSYTDTAGTALNQIGLIWESITNWVQTDPVKAALYAAIPLAVCAIPVAYAWFHKTLFSYHEESLMPKVTREGARGRAPLRTHMPMARKIDLTTQSGCSVNLRDISKLIADNRFEIEISNLPGIRQCSAIGIYNRYLVLPRHLMMQFAAESEDDPSLKMKFTRARTKSGHSFSMSYQDMTDNRVLIDFEENFDKTEHDRFNDRIILRIPEVMMGCVPDIRKHLCSRTDRVWNQSSIKGTVNLISTSDGRIIEQFWDTAFVVDTKMEHSTDLSIINGLFYSCSTAQGDCGSPLYTDVSGSAKLLGFHIAGSAPHCIAVGIAIRSEDFLFLNDVPVNVLARDIPLASSSIVGDEAENKVPGTGRVLARLDTRIYQPTRSVHEHAPMYHVLPPCNLERSVLRDKLVDGVVVRPLIQGLANYNIPRVMFPVDHLEEVAHSVYTTAVETGCHGERILTLEEAVYGNDEMNAIPKDTSLGIPLCDWATATHKGKTIIMGRGEEKYGPKWDACIAEYNSLKARILAGENPTVLFKAIIKDELLPAEKVAKANSRITYTAPFLLQVLTRQQYGDMSKNIMKKSNMVLNRQALGLNVFAEWDILATFLTKFGEKRMLDFDYRKYDGSLGRQLLMAAFDIMDRLYPNDSPEDKAIKAWIRAQTVNAAVAYDDVVVEYDGSNTSGNSLTTIINNLCNQILCLFVLSSFILKQSGKKYEIGLIDFSVIAENLRMCTLGDDVIMGLGPIFDAITTRDFAEILAPYNIAITNGDKTDPVTNPKGLRSLKDVTFLKRAFLLIDGRYVAPLAMASICKMIQWKSRSVSDDEYALIVQNALLELSLHGKAVYDECLAAMAPTMAVLGIAPHTSSWRTEFIRAQNLTHTWSS